MNRRVVFLDVDGTLVDHHGLVPDSARAAVQRARANGHLVFLCTGRSTSAIWPDLLDIGFDGVIAAAGGYVEVAGQVVAHQFLAEDQVRRVMDFFDARGVEYLLESNEGFFGSPNAHTRLAELIFGSVTDEDVLAQLERGLGGFIDAIRVGEEPFGTRINKVSYLDSPTTLDEISAAFGEEFDIIPTTVPLFGRNSGEMALRGVHKAAGIDEVLAYLRADRASTIAIGDGLNDLEMLQHAAVGIAMGNARPEVKAVADETTGAPHEHGIRTALQRHGLL